MKVAEMKQKDVAELEVELGELQKEQFNLRMQQGSGQLARPHLMKNVRRNIARVKTVISAKTVVGE